MSAALAAIPAPPEPRLSAFSVISFDIFDSLVDWDSGTHDALLASFLQLSQDDLGHVDLEEKQSLVRIFTALLKDVQHEHPMLPYVQMLEQAHYRLMAQALKLESTSVASSNGFASLLIGDWPAYPDSVRSLNRLKSMGFKIVLFSNLDPETVQKTLSGPLEGFEPDGLYSMHAGTHISLNVKEFDKVLAQFMQSFPGQPLPMLHVAKGLKHELTSSTNIGIASIRGEQKVDAIAAEIIRDRGRVCWRFNTLEQMADACENDLRNPPG